MDKKITIGELFTLSELKKARDLYIKCNGVGFKDRAKAEIVLAAIPRINKKTGEENNADYMSYLLEYAVQQMR